MTEPTNQTAAAGRVLPHGLEEMERGSDNPEHAALVSAVEMAGVMLAKMFDVFGNVTGFPAPQAPHTFAAALGDVAGMAAADPEKGELFRAGLSVEDYAEVLAVSVRENLLLSVERMRERLEATGAATYQELADAMEQAEGAEKH